MDRMILLFNQIELSKTEFINKSLWILFIQSYL